MELGEPAAGQLLISTEPGRGGYFDRSVVLLLEHNEEGSLGVCLHRMGRIPMVDSLEHFSDLLTPPAKLFEGGPVSKQTALGLAQVRSPWEEPPGWRRLFGDVGVLDLETPVELVQGTYVHIRIYVGLAGWSAGQLVGELLRGSWFRSQAAAEEVFGTPEELWRRVLRRIGGGPGFWSTWTGHPEWN